MSLVGIIASIFFTVFFLATIRAIYEKNWTFWIFAVLTGLASGFLFWGLVIVIGSLSIIVR